MFNEVVVVCSMKLLLFVQCSCCCLFNEVVVVCSNSSVSAHEGVVVCSNLYCSISQRASGCHVVAAAGEEGLAVAVPIHAKNGRVAVRGLGFRVWGLGFGV